MRLIGSFRIFKALIAFLLLVCGSYVPNQNGKDLEETLAGFNSDLVKTTLRQRLSYFKMAVPFLQVFQSLSIPQFLPIQ